MLPPPDLERAFFDPHLHGSFRTQVGSGSEMELELTEIVSLPPYPGAKRQPFVLTFRSKDRTAHPQRTYKLSHPQLGELEIFLVPIGPDAVGMRYEAVFS